MDGRGGCVLGRPLQHWISLVDDSSPREMTSTIQKNKLWLDIVSALASAIVPENLLANLPEEELLKDMLLYRSSGAAFDLLSERSLA